MVLNTEPSGDVTVTVNVPAGSGLTVTGSPLTFTATGGDIWSTPKRVEVTANDDGDAVDDTATLTHSVTGADYAHVTAASVTVNVDDDDAAGVNLASGTLAIMAEPDEETAATHTTTITEVDVTDENKDGTATGTYMVVLTAAPTGNATITITSNNSDVWVDTDDAAGVQDTLTFTTENSGTPQPVTVYVADDGDGTDDTAVLSHRISGYEGLADDFEEPQTPDHRH